MLTCTHAAPLTLQNALLDDMYETWVHDVSASLGKSREEVSSTADWWWLPRCLLPCSISAC